MSLNRRHFIAASTLALAGAGVGGTWLARSTQPRRGVLLSAFEDAGGDQFVGGLSLETRRVFGTRVPMRAHGCAIDPLDPARVIFFARRPGTQAFELRRDTLGVRTLFETPRGRHLAGHGLYSPDGRLLYTPEHDYERMRGVVAVRDARSFAVIGEIDTHGIDPHEIAWRADGRTLLVANGGIMTHPRSYRRKLNIPTMDPSLCAIDVASGACVGQWRLPDHLLSIRHLALGSDDTVAIGLQYEGAPEAAPGIAAVYRPAAGLTLLTAPPAERAKFQGYVASVAIAQAHDMIAAACPYGGGIACWSLRDARYLGFIAAAETYGLSRLADGEIAASQRDGSALRFGETRLESHFLKFTSEKPIRWDDHWVAAA